MHVRYYRLVFMADQEGRYKKKDNEPKEIQCCCAVVSLKQEAQARNQDIDNAEQDALAGAELFGFQGVHEMPNE